MRVEEHHATKIVDSELFMRRWAADPSILHISIILSSNLHNWNVNDSLLVRKNAKAMIKNFMEGRKWL